MSIETDNVSRRGAVARGAPIRRWLFGLGLQLATLSLLASAELSGSPVASQGATASQATASDQGTKPGGGDLATIIQSGSTNTIGYKLVIHRDGSAAGMDNSSGSPRAQVVRREYPAGTIATDKLQRLLAAIGDVSKIPIGACMKSASFGTTTEISYAGKVSGNLQCVPHQASGGDEALLQSSEDLAALVRAIQHQLKLDIRRVGPNQ
jgi:hypothetical protein